MSKELLGQLGSAQQSYLGNNGAERVHFSAYKITDCKND